ncbi:hypothetical protein ACTXJX_16725 [Glutamicibacter ardleyensis]|uniref:hypothetical protein n=1 Tax=Glutamicibacter ardleyensis TaxID=225894 RepID=UPI003F8E5D38
METATMDLLSASEASKLLGLSAAKLHAWAAAKDAGEDVDAPPHYRVSERKRLWSRPDLLAWLESRKVQ